MTQRIEKLAVLFADICGSTALYDQLGDDVARQMVSRCINTMCQAISEHNGTLIKTIGDEVMCTFPSAEEAFNGACAMQRAVRDDRAGGRPMFIRVGFHYGDAILESGDVFGDTVNIAARVASITRAGQIMTTTEVGELLPPDLKEKTKHILRTELKGKQEQVDIYLVIWEDEDVMSTRIMTPASRKTADSIDELALRYRDQSCKVNKDNRKAMMGRGDSCDIVVTASLASRQHVAIEFRAGKFVIADQSTNGTYVRFADGHVVHITREEVVLQGKGTISLGESYAGRMDDLVEFSTGTSAVAQP